MKQKILIYNDGIKNIITNDLFEKKKIITPKIFSSSTIIHRRNKISELFMIPYKLLN